MRPLKFLDKLVEEKLQAVLASEFSSAISASQPQDIFVAGYPKSGNTWMQYLGAGIQYGIPGDFLTDRLANELAPDVHERRYHRRYGSFNFFKTHHLPRPEYRRVIYLVRDGRDAMVSYFAMHRSQKLGGTLEEMVKEGKHVFPGPWWEHVRAWTANPHGAEMMTLRYEDLIAQPLQELRRVCAFAHLERDDELLERIIRSNSFSDVKERARQYAAMGHQEWAKPVNQNFFRKGKVGSYREEMPADLIAWFTQAAAAELKQFGYDTQPGAP